MPLDHLVYAVPDLDEGVAEIERSFGVRPSPGGRHPGFGTHNALLGLGGECYLELIAPDPEQGDVERRLFGLGKITEPELLTWAARTSDLETRIEKARAAGVELGRVVEMSRRRGDGTLLEWRLTLAPELPEGGLVPFFIDWGETPHPAPAATQGCRLLEFYAEHPRPAELSRKLGAVGAELDVREALRPALIALLDTPNGRLELR